MNDSSADRIARLASAEMHSHDAAAQALGITVESVSPGRARLRMLIRDDMVNGHDLCHGGLLFALADTAFAHACNSHNRRAIATGCSIEFVRPGRRGQFVTATAEERWRSGRTGVYDVNIEDSDGDLLALFRGKSFTLGDALVDPEGA